MKTRVTMVIDVDLDIDSERITVLTDGLGQRIYELASWEKDGLGLGRFYFKREEIAPE